MNDERTCLVHFSFSESQTYRYLKECDLLPAGIVQVCRCLSWSGEHLEWCIVSIGRCNYANKIHLY